MPANPVIPGVHFDGDFTKPVAISLRHYDFPFRDRGDLRSFTYRQQFQWHDDFYKPPLVDTPGASGTRLVDTTAPDHLGAGVITFWNEYAILPESWSEPEVFAYGIQGEETSGGEEVTTTLVEIAKPVNSRMLYEYFWRPDWVTNPVPVLTAVRLAQLGTDIYATGGEYPPTPNSAGEIVAEDSKVRRWKGHFIERVTRYVKAADVTLT
ncbi:MAG: hypothetical protein QOD99_1916 [Chthoniobacter sp.]|jgi:hypothetical protein|nr:hypothetical protein [Chthoniobacter sp.]